MKSAKNSKGRSAKSSKEPTFHYGFILRAYPSFQQMTMIEKNINAARFYYNFLVAQDNKLYRIGKEPAVTIPWLHDRRKQILEETYGKAVQKQRQKVARLSHKVFKQRKSFLHEVAKAYVKNHDVVVAEELRSKNLLKNHNLAKSLQDVGHRTFLTMLEQKAEMYGKTFLAIDPAYTTQTCHCCGHVLKGKEKITLNDREWTCPVCGVHHDRDHNAALNILAKGVAQLGSVSRLKCAG